MASHFNINNANDSSCIISDTDSYYHLPMDAFSDNKLVNPSGLDAKAIGAPEMVPGVKGQALQIDGQIQKVRVSGPGHRMECFGDLSLCPDGTL